jgi:hypothetical protein
LEGAVIGEVTGYFLTGKSDIMDATFVQLG